MDRTDIVLPSNVIHHSRLFMDPQLRPQEQLSNNGTLRLNNLSQSEQQLCIAIRCNFLISTSLKPTSKISSSWICNSSFGRGLSLVSFQPVILLVILIILAFIKSAADPWTIVLIACLSAADLFALSFELISSK